MLRQTFANTSKLKSASVELKMAGADGHAVLSGPIVAEQAGKLPQFALKAKVTWGSQSKTLGATWTGDRGFVALEGKTYAVPAALMQMATAGYQQALQQGPQLGLNASKWIVAPRNAGLTTVGGVQTVKLTGKADMAQIKADLEKLGQGMPGLGASDLSGAGQAVKNATVTVYTGAADQILRRLVVNADVKGAATVLDLTLTGVNAPHKITAPAHARPFSELLPQLKGGALPGGGTRDAGFKSGERHIEIPVGSGG